MKHSRIGLAVGLALLVLVLVGGLGLPTAGATTSTYTAAGVTITKGSTVSGTYVNTQADDASYHRVADDALYYMDLYYVLGPFSIDNESWMSRIDTRWQAKQAGSKLHNLYWYDFDGAAWVDMGTGTFGTSDTNIDDYQTSNLARFRNSTGYFRFRYYCYDGEAVPDLYSDYIYVTYTWAIPNYAPVNLQASCKNLDDGDNLYARYKAYTFTSNTSDANGYADLNYIDLFLMHTATVRFQVRFTESTNAFSEVSGDHITLNAGSCSYVKSGNWINLTWSVTFEWTCAEEADDDVKLGAMDDSSASDLDTYDVNYDIGSTLDLNPTMHDLNGLTRGNVNGIVHFHGTLWYYIEPTTHPNPPVAEVDMWVTCTDVAGSPFAQLNPTSYPFEVDCYADDVAGLDTYTLKVVAEGGGSGGTDLLHTTHSTTYIADQITVTGYTTSDARDNIGDTIWVDCELHYDYDSAAVSDGSVTLSGYSTSYQGAGKWRYSDSSGTVASITFNTAACSGNTYGVTSVNQNGQSQTVIWDRVQVQSLTVNDTWTGINYYIQFTIVLYYDCDDSNVTDGAVTLWGGVSLYVSCTHISGGTWRANATKSSPAEFSSVVLYSVSGNAYDISAIATNGKSVAVKWDWVLMYYGGTSDTTPDNGIFPGYSTARVNVGTSVLIYFHLQYYMGGQVATGHPTANGTSLTYRPDISPGWWAGSFSYATIGLRLFAVTWYGDDDAQILSYIEYTFNHGIWDQINVTLTAPTYWKLSSGLNASGLTYSRIYGYGGASFTGTVTLNDTDFAHASAGRYGYTVASVSGCPYGITAFDANSLPVIWETVSYSFAYTWMRVTGGEYWVRLDLINLVWSVEATTIPDAAVFTFYENASLFHTASPSSGQLIDVVEDYNAGWYYVTWTVKITYTVAPYSFTAYLFVSMGPMEVPVEHTLYIETFDSGLTDYYFSFYVETNWRNACCAVWVNGSSMTYFSSEGWHQIAKPTGLGVWNITILVNGSAPLGSAYQHYGLGSGGAWKYRWTLIEVQAETTLFFYFYDLNGEPISWGSEAQPFLVYVNGTQAPHQGLWIRSSVSTVNITLVDLWGYTLYANTSYAIETVGDTVVRLQLTMWRIILVNRQLETCYAIVGFNLYNRTFYVDKGGFTPLNVYAGSFEVWWYRAADGGFIEHEGPVTLTADTIFFTAYVPELPPSGGGGGNEDTTPWWAKEPWPTLIITGVIVLVGAGIVISSRRRANRQTQILLAGPQPEPEPERTPESVIDEANERQQEQIEESVRQMSGEPLKKKRRSKKH